MPGRSRPDDLGAKVMRELLFSSGRSVGDTRPGERLLRQAKNVLRDGIEELKKAVGTGAVSVADAEKIARFDAATQGAALKSDPKAFVRQFRDGKRKVEAPASCLKCTIAESVQAIMKAVPDDRIDAAVCQVLAELAKVREARLSTKNSPKPTLRGRKVAKTLGFAESATLPIEQF